MQAGWLSANDVDAKAQELIEEIRKEVRSKRSHTITTTLETVARIAIQADRERGAVFSAWFESSIGLLDGSEKETWYISEARIGSRFAAIGLVTWTTWIGDVVTRVRNAILDGTFPESMTYGPRGRESTKLVGPFVEYHFRDSILERADFKFGKYLLPEISKPEEPPAPPQYGLRTIIRSLDLSQNDQIRGPLQGIFILTGGPGTGKTTVALHRIPFLIDAHADPNIKISSTAPKVTEESTLVVVWEPHLAPYLKRCLDELGLTGIPPENVALIHEWLSEQIRKTIPFGPKGYRKSKDSPFMGHLKSLLTESMLREFLDSSPSLTAFLRAEMRGLCEEVRVLFQALEIPMPEPILESSADATTPDDDLLVEAVEEVENVIQDSVQPKRPKPFITYRNLRGRINRLLKELQIKKDSNKLPVGLDPGATEKQLEFLNRLVPAARLVALLTAFYDSDGVRQLVLSESGTEGLVRFKEEIKHQTGERRLSERDWLMLLWLAEFPESSELLRHRFERLPRFGHIVIDEAQYYEPIVLRLLAVAAQIPNGTMTIVGDLEQRIKSVGGLLSWEAAGLTVPAENVNRLDINYRWSEAVFDFLDVFRAASEIEKPLVRPRKWYARNGERPQVRTFQSQKDELECVVDELSRLRGLPNGELWTVAVIVPEAYQVTVQEELIPALDECAIAARWADGEDVKDSVHKVIVTKYDCIVGLEFNAVFVLGVNEILRTGAKEEVQSVWVALSRAHQYLFVSRVKGDPIFNAVRFDAYRK